MDEQLEKAIDEVGRQKVFDRARAYGWTAGHDVPKWVWWNIVSELRYQPDLRAHTAVATSALSILGL